MRLRTLTVAGMGTAALVLATFATGMASASGSASHVSLLASGVGSHGTATAAMIPARKGKCGTGFGPELPTPDGIIAWNDTSGTGFNTAGAASVTCGHATMVKSVKAYGYFGTATESFNVTFYANDPADGTNEPNDNSVICSYTGLTGAAGGQYPTHVLTKLHLSSRCNLPAGESWVAIQNNDSAGPWYWEMQNTATGDSPDWGDVNNVFGSGCTTFDNDLYLSNCLGYTYPAWMLKLN